MVRTDELGRLVGPLHEQLAEANRAREAGLASCRRVIRSAGRAIRALHRLEPAVADELIAEAGAALTEAQVVLAPHPAIAHAGFLHDAEKEYAEARLTAALVGGLPLPSAEMVGVAPAAWLNGLAEAASELRRHLLDRLRGGEHGRAEALFEAMDDVYGVLVAFDEPDAVTGGLRRTTDQLRAVLERTRSDLTTTVVQARLQAALEREAPRSSA